MSTHSSRYSGRICCKLEDICFVQPSKTLPLGYKPDNVRIFIDNFSPDGLEIQVGDIVSFKLGTKDPRKPMGFKPQVVQCSKRTFGEVSEYLSRCIKNLQKSEMRTAIALLSPNNRAVWYFLVALNVEDEINTEIVFQLFECFELIAKHAENSRYEELTKEALVLFLEGSTFSKFVSGAVEEKERNKITRFCNTVSKYLPSHNYAVYPLISKLTEGSKENVDVEFLLSIISNSSCARKAEAISEAMLPSNLEFSSTPLDTSSNLVPVKTDKPYTSYQEYGEIYYHLLRAEAFSAIQNGILSLKNHTFNPRDMHIYLDITMTDVQVSGKALGFIISFKPIRKVTNWKSSRQLMYGNLLCLSPRGNFLDPIWAVVCEKTVEALQNDLTIVIKFLEDNHLPLGEILADLIAYSGKIVMLESPIYYEAIQSSLVRFRSINLENYTLGKDIVFGKDANSSNQIPAYLENNLPEDLNEALDASQQEAFDLCLKNKIGIIQGPPGTGKTYVGFHLAKYLLSLDLDGPILMLSYKNHALDEFLLQILDICDKDDVVRIGGQSKEPKLDKILLRQHIGRSIKLDFDALEEYCIKLKKMIKTYASSAILGNNQLDDRLNNQHTNKSQINRKKRTKKATLEHWGPSPSYLKDLKKIEAAFVPVQIDKKEMIVGEEEEYEDEDLFAEFENERMVKFFSINKRQKTKPYFDFQSLPTKGYKLADFPANCAFNEGILSAKNLWDLDMSERIQFIYTLLRKRKNEFEDGVEELQFNIKEVIGSGFHENTLLKLETLKDMKVIGATITGAAIHHQLLNALRPKVVIVEEAAEILEPSLVAAINPKVEHLILIGDHKQLRPSVNSYNLVKHHRFDMSMMERLINIGYPYSILEKQGRMRTEFAEMLTDIYPDYLSFTDINNKRPPFPNFSKTMYFWSHSFPETKDRSYKNEKEADMALSIAYFIIACGVAPSNITILAAYVNQLKMLRRKYSEYKSISCPNRFSQSSDIMITTIDMYQGDENEFVIISLVRSNNDKKIGFLKHYNRRCVAQSRAKRGMYFVGNVNCFINHNTWSGFIEKMKEQECVGSSIFVKCDSHSGLKQIDNSQQLCTLSKSTGLLCSQPCEFEFSDCGHSCPKKCKPFHNHQKCFTKVPYTVPDCKHKFEICCFKTAQEKSIICEEMVLYVCDYNHRSHVKCHDKKMKNVKCGHPCIKVMDCKEKHLCNRKCGEYHSHIYCTTMVYYTFPKCNHMSIDQKMCDVPITSFCEVDIKFKGSCGHLLIGQCYKVAQNKNSIPCEYPCRKMLQCGHPCGGICSRACLPCEICKKMEEKRIKEFHKNIQKKIDNLKKSASIDIGITITELSYDSAEYQSKEDIVMKYIKPMHNWYPKVTGIRRVINSTLERKFLQACVNGYGDYTDLKFHGTSIHAIKEITEYGFRLPENPGMYGKGIYLATDSSKSAQEIYTKGSMKLLLCEVFLGKTFTFSGSNQRISFLDTERAFKGNYGNKFLTDHKCDSVYAPRNSEVKNDEFIVFNPNQVYPKYIISYTVGEVLRHRPELPTSTNGFKKHRYKFTRNIDTLDPYYIEASVAVAHYNRTNRGEKNTFSTDEIDIVLNEALEKRFNDMKKELKKKGYGEEILAFHSTKLENIDSILRNNLDPKIKAANGRVYGDGCYFSEFPDFSGQYGNSMILFRVLPGKEYIGKDILPQSGFDSKKVRGDNKGYGEQIIIQNADQFLPAYVLYKKP